MKPNFLFLIVDQLSSRAIRCNGNLNVNTPNIDKLAEKGVNFKKAYCTHPLCGPSRASLFTSRMPASLGITGNNFSQLEISEKNVETLGEVFSRNGYTTAYAGKWHLQGSFPGYSSRFKIPGFNILPLQKPNINWNFDQTKYAKGLTVDPSTVSTSIEFLSKNQNPFFLTVSFLNPHDICEFEICDQIKKIIPKNLDALPKPLINQTTPQAFSGEKSGVETKGWDEKKWREYLYVYYYLIEEVDRRIGEVLQKIPENTIVLLTSDHGDMMGAHKMIGKTRFYDESSCVPLIISGPGIRNYVEKHVVSGLDIMPTFLDYAGIDVKGLNLQGSSLKPLIDGSAVDWRDFAACCSQRRVREMWRGSRMLRTSRYKYITEIDYDNEQFFDMEKDPGEEINIINSIHVKEEVSKSRVLLKKWLKNTEDPFIWYLQ